MESLANRLIQLALGIDAEIVLIISALILSVCVIIFKMALADRIILGLAVIAFVLLLYRLMPNFLRQSNSNQ